MITMLIPDSNTRNRNIHSPIVKHRRIKTATFMETSGLPKISISSILNMIKTNKKQKTISKAAGKTFGVVTMQRKVRMRRMPTLLHNNNNNKTLSLEKAAVLIRIFIEQRQTLNIKNINDAAPDPGTPLLNQDSHTLVDSTISMIAAVKEAHRRRIRISQMNSIVMLMKSRSKTRNMRDITRIGFRNKELLLHRRAIRILSIMIQRASSINSKNRDSEQKKRKLTRSTNRSLTASFIILIEGLIREICGKEHTGQLSLGTSIPSR